MVAVVILWFSIFSRAEEPKILKSIEIIAEREGVDIHPSGYQNKSYSGKKATQIKMSDKLVAPTNVYRSAMAELPGLMSTEVNNDSWVSLSYRGLGDPHETYNLNILKNGLPTAADIYGYPGHYFSPPPESLQSIHFLRGGAGLLYGPQPMGVLNWIQKMPQTNNQESVSDLSLRGGSFGLFSGYASHSQSSEKWGMLASVHRRQADGFRDANGDFGITNARWAITYDLNTQHAITLDYDHYSGRFGEPGGLGRQTRTNYLGIDTTWRGSTLNHDRVHIDRDQTTLSLRSKWSERFSTQFDNSFTLLRRESFRQNLGLTSGESAFGRIPTDSTNTIQNQYFRTFQSQLTAQQDHDIFGLRQKWVTGISYYQVDSPFDQSTGATVNAEQGTPQRALDRNTRAFSVFTENHIHAGDWKISPGVRLESIRLSIDEELNAAAPTSLREEQVTYNIPLLALGIEYEMANEAIAYFNASQGFKPVTFQDSVPLAPGDSISEDLKAGRINQYEVGWKSQSAQMAVDVSAFYIDFENRFGRSGNQIINVGRSVHYGLDGLFHVRLVQNWSAYMSHSLLQAEIKDDSGTARIRGNRPQYAPQLVSRLGATWNYARNSRLQLQAQYISSQAGDDANSAQFYIPSYTVFDVMGETLVFESTQSQWMLSYGLMNLGGEKYIARIRPNGIEPGTPTNFYLGIRSTF
jgi:Fe(3+) dicitrate transport protein